VKLGKLTFCALLAGGLLHLAALAGLLQGRPLPWLVPAHLAGALAWGWGAAPLLPASQQAAWWLLAGCALVFPGVGPLASLVLVRGLHRRAADADLGQQIHIAAGLAVGGLSPQRVSIMVPRAVETGEIKIRGHEGPDDAGTAGIHAAVGNGFDIAPQQHVLNAP